MRAVGTVALLRSMFLSPAAMVQSVFDELRGKGRLIHAGAMRSQILLGLGKNKSRDEAAPHEAGNCR